MNLLEKLSGDRAGQHSIRINDQWRICFESIDAYNIEIVGNDLDVVAVAPGNRLDIEVRPLTVSG
jgi:hypothetical protein